MNAQARLASLARAAGLTVLVAIVGTQACTACGRYYLDETERIQAIELECQRICGPGESTDYCVEVCGTRTDHAGLWN